MKWSAIHLLTFIGLTSCVTSELTGQGLDIAFLMDGSGSVGADNFIVMKTFVKNLTASLLEFNTSFAFVQYSSGTTIHVNFHQFQRTGWENQVDSISQIGSNTYTAGAIQTVVNDLFDSSAGARPNAHRILIVLTDGQSSDASTYPSATALADRKNITRYAIGIGNVFDSQSATDELRSIASSPESDYVFKVDSFEALDKIISSLVKRITVIEATVMRRQIVRVELQVNLTFDLNNTVVQDEILNQIKLKLQEQGLPSNTKLSWIKQPDGQIFHKKYNEKSVKEQKKSKDEF
ncbi:integrin alpha-D-like isoform X1 [Alosa sapidissima]|uniref:integrin alpha-D-like isoform X1 n=1 Tax=Alosa sapidissima TaxID=34773 RepID=UPI001C08612B|nr:integrin alpha-D-like isoform X1 [Alosa sapidissima]XP_041941061.1 integrin alpha-D-like isoform X1 [Alosa sapidissima]